MLCSTQDYPYEPFQDGRRFGGNFEHRLAFLTGYKGPSLDDQVYEGHELTLREPSPQWTAAPAGSRELELRAGETRVFGLVFDDPADPAGGFDTLLLAMNKDGEAARLKPRAAAGADAFAPFTLGPGGLTVYFRLFTLSGDGRDILLYRSRAGALLSNRQGLRGEASRQVDGFVGNGASHLYEQGALGPTIAQGGDGTAERRYLETVRLVERQFERLLAFGTRSTRWNVLFGYLPYPDEFLHLWWGQLDPSLEGHDPERARRLRPFMDEGLRIADDYVGALVRHAGDDTILALATDHGMIGVRTRLSINVVLREAGLLAADHSGQVDPARSSAYFEEASGLVLLNRVSRAKGIVRPEDEDGVRARIREALLRVPDPRTGRSLVTAVEDAPFPVGGPARHTDLSFRLAPGAFPSGEIEGAMVQEGSPAGEHLLEPERPDMFGSFVVAGPGVRSGADLGVIDQRDIAPTLAALLGLGPPVEAEGRVLVRALAR
jgi:hypothetical protein